MPISHEQDHKQDLEEPERLQNAGDLVRRLRKRRFVHEFGHVRGDERHGHEHLDGEIPVVALVRTRPIQEPESEDPVQGDPENAGDPPILPPGPAEHAEENHGLHVQHDLGGPVDRVRQSVL